MSVVEYRCVFCGRVFKNKWALRGHLRVHKGEMVNFNVRIPRTVRDDFKRLCEGHGVTTCHMVMTVIHALSEAFRRGVNFEFDVRSDEMRFKEGSNPIMISLTQNFLGKPRSGWKTWIPDNTVPGAFRASALSRESRRRRSRMWYSPRL